MESCRARGSRRRPSAERIVEQLGVGGKPTLLCGDLNAPPNSAALSVLQHQLTDAWQVRGLGFGMTSSARTPLRRIDYLMVRGLEVGDIDLLEELLSDHRAVTATFVLTAR